MLQEVKSQLNWGQRISAFLTGEVVVFREVVDPAPKVNEASAQPKPTRRVDTVLNDLENILRDAVKNNVIIAIESLHQFIKKHRGQ